MCMENSLYENDIGTLLALWNLVGSCYAPQHPKWVSHSGQSETKKYLCFTVIFVKAKTALSVWEAWHLSVCVCGCALLRAAAHSKLGHYTEATVDCERAIAIDPTYSKAYGRMG